MYYLRIVSQKHELICMNKKNHVSSEHVSDKDAALSPHYVCMEWIVVMYCMQFYYYDIHSFRFVSYRLLLVLRYYYQFGAEKCKQQVGT